MRARLFSESRLAFALAATTFCSVPALGIGLSLSEAGDFNLLTWGNATLLNSDTEGRVAVGGNATFSSYSIGNMAELASPADAAFVVGGNLTASHGSVAKGSIHVGGSYSGPGYSLNTAAGSVTAANLGKSNVGFDFAAAQSALSARSLAYGGEAATGGSVLQWSTLTLTGADADLNVFSITAAELAASSTLNIVVPEFAKALINVSGSIVEFSNKGLGGNFGARDTLFNFHEATQLNMSGIGVIGSILAPFADVRFQSGQMNGQLIANSFAGAPWGVGEMHNYAFSNSPADEPDEPRTRVPDTGVTAGMFALGVGALLLLTQQYRSAGKGSGS